MTIIQLIVDAHGCEGPLNDAATLLARMEAAARAAGAQTVGQAQARYVPHGVTAIVFLAESHILISTWPEYRLALVDILLCNPRMDPEGVWDRLARTLRPAGEVRIRRSERQVGATPE
ncbi:MAG: S-adenosylmethionine decarboxylase [Magnetococcales bacterium]|nr:S-adenosylmethionine decarboxylase [Magnetococcales bacterium]